MSEQAALFQPAAPATRGPWLTRPQIIMQVALLGFLAVLLAVMLAIDYGRTSLLFRDSLGQKMLIQAAALVGMGLVLRLLVCVGLNLLLPAGATPHKTLRFVLSIVI